MRRLDRDTMFFVKERSHTTLDEAIKLAAEADLENATWNSVHGVRNYGGKDTPVIHQKRVAAIRSNADSVGNRKRNSLSSIQCFDCQEFGHYKRNCPKLNEMDNHVINQYRLKQRHDRERQNKRSCFTTKMNLNSIRGRQNGSMTSLNQNYQPENASCSRSDQIEYSQTPHYI